MAPLSRWRALGRDPAFGLLFVALAACTLVPIWRPRYLPLIDLPNHLFAIAVWLRLDDPSWGYGRSYTANVMAAPYLGHYLPVHLLAQVFPLETANKVYLSLYAVGLALSLRTLALRCGRDGRVALLALPLALNFNFGWGFLSFCGALPLLLLALASLIACLDTPRPASLVVLALLATAVYFAHLLAWLFFGFCAAIVLLARACHQRRAALWAAVAMLPSLLPALAHLARRDATRMFLAPAGATAWKFGWEEPRKALALLADQVLMRHPGPADRVALIALGLSLLMLLASAPVGEAAPGTRRPTRLPLLLVLAALFAYLAAPMRMWAPFDWWNLSPRFASVAALFLLLVPAGPIRGWRGAALLPGLAAAVLHPIGLSDRMMEFDRTASGFRRVMALVPRGADTLVQIVRRDMGTGHLTEGIRFFEFNAYAAIEKGGYNPFGFQSGFPYRERPDAAARLPHPTWTSKWGHYDQRAMGQHWDYLVTFEEPAAGSLMGIHAERVPLIASDEGWRLYHTKGIP